MKAIAILTMFFLPGTFVAVSPISVRIIGCRFDPPSTLVEDMITNIQLKDSSLQLGGYLNRQRS
jgi:hypothetical protein